MNKITTGMLAAAAALAILSGSAHAAYEGFGDGLPLSAAASQIVPEGWSVDYAEGVDKSAPVSWTNASDWKAALSSAVAKKGYSAEFGGSTVIIRKAAPAARVAEAPRRSEAKPERASRPAAAPRGTPKASPERREAAPAETGGGGFKISTYRKPAPPALAVPKKAEGEAFRPYAGASVSKDGADGVAASRMGFSVTDGETLRVALERWASASRWEVVWKSAFDYPIEASASFQGDFVAASTALVEAMGDARPVITVDFYTGNHVVVVSNAAADEAN